MFQLSWVFRNDHEWHKNFDSIAQRDQFINTTGLISHPDIVQVKVQIGQEFKYLKKVLTDVEIVL